MFMNPEDHKFLFCERPHLSGSAKKGSRDYFVVYKSCLAVALLGMFIYGYSDQQYNPKDVHGSHSYTDYVSNWNDIACTLWASMNALMAAFPQSPGHLYGLLSGLNAIAPTFSIGVAGAFWLLLPAERQSKDLVSLHQHGFLAVITVIDLLICAAPIRYFHILSTWIFAGAYAINTMLVYYIFGASRDEIYPFLDYQDKFIDAVKFDLFMTFGVQSIVFTTLYVMSKIKYFFIRRCSVSQVEGVSISKKGLLDSSEEFNNDLSSRQEGSLKKRSIRH